MGPSGDRMAENLDEGEHVARQAEAAGMNVSRVFHPNATWARVRERTEGANLVVYLGHGNGWPSPYAPFQERTKNGFGLNPYAGASGWSTEYRGGDEIRSKIRLADDAIVLLYYACYAPGAGEPGQPIPSVGVARERTDNYAAAFLAEKVGAAAVFAFWTTQSWDFPGALMREGRTIDQVFRTPASASWSTGGFNGSNDSYHASDRTDGARLHLDPHPDRGYVRAVTGDLEMTTDDWLDEAPDPEPEPDESAPELSDFSTSLPGGSEAETTFSPNGDGIDDELIFHHRVSEASWIDIEVAEDDGTVRRRLTSWTEGGDDTSTWTGEDERGDLVPDGSYRVTARARDTAGNESEARAVDVVALGTLRDPGWSRSAIHSRDEDGTADEADYRVELTSVAQTSVHIENRAGSSVRTIHDAATLDAGKLTIGWNGLDDAGSAVPDGRYWAVASATTDVGTVTYRSGIHVGAYRVGLSDRTPRRGQRITLRVRASEDQRRSPELRLEQPGLSAYSIRTTRNDSGRYVAVVTLRSSGQAGTLEVTVLGVDVNGQDSTFTRSVALD